MFAYHSRLEKGHRSEQPDVETRQSCIRSVNYVQKDRREFQKCGRQSCVHSVYYFNKHKLQTSLAIELLLSISCQPLGHSWQTDRFWYPVGLECERLLINPEVERKVLCKSYKLANGRFLVPLEAGKLKLF